MPLMTRAALVWALLIASLFAQSLREKIDVRAQKSMEAQGIVGMAVAVVVDGEIVYVGGYGWADREAELPVTEETRFRWASISKPLTAVAALQLAEQGKLDLDADIRRYVPEFPEKEKPITARQLLCHRSGIPHYSNGVVIKTKRDYDTEHPFADVINALDYFKESPLLFEPGSKNSYTTYGYILLGAVVQRAAGQDYAKYIDENIAEPLGLQSLEPDYQWLDLPHRAKGYRKIALTTQLTGNTDVSWKLPGGGYLSNAGDMARFAIGLMDGKLVSKETEKAMWTPQPPESGKKSGYALGFSVSDDEGQLTVGHGGAQQKVSTQLLFSPEGRCAVAILANTEDVKLGKLSRELLELALEEAAAGVR